MLLNTFIKSEKNHLILFSLGEENENGFSGIIIYENQTFFIEQNRIFRSLAPKYDLLNKNFNFWSVVFNQFEASVVFDHNVFIFDKINQNKVYCSVLEGKEMFFSNKNYENPFSIDLLILLKGFIHTDKSLLEFLSRDISLHSSLISLEKLRISVDSFKSTKLNQKFNKLLSSYGFLLK
jgi:hypothetical protein